MTATDPLGLAVPAAAGLSLPHHDGSDLYVAERPSQPGGEAALRLRLPRGAAADADAVALRYVRDGEPRFARAQLDAESATERWWVARFEVAAEVTSYRWLLSGGAVGYAWVNALGTWPFDVPDDGDFVLSLAPPGPDWHLRSVVYEIFPDRFATAGLGVERPGWAVPRAWDERPTGRGPATPFEHFGGDLVGAARRLDHLAALGVGAVYLTPFFPAGSTHRYDATSFEHVDPLLGGDEALVAFVRAAHERGIRVVGDLTLNHVGSGHPWFRAAQADAAAAERAFFWFGEEMTNGYEAWYGVPTLPKLDHRADELRRRLVEGDDSVARRFLRPPFDLDGWRIDVANMAGRRGDVDENAALARATRAAVTAARADGVLIAEHAYDARRDLPGAGWHGTMNYAGFTRPVWAWLRGGRFEGEEETFLGVPTPLPRLPGTAAAATMHAFRAGVPWSSVLHSWTLLDSHDTGRFRSVAGSRERHHVGIGLQMTTPGVPMVFAGDELGLEGAWGEDARRPTPWDRPERWDAATLEAYRRLIALRRSSDALARGGLRWAHVGDEALAYLRESPSERVLCLAARSAHEPVELSLAALGASALEPLAGADAEVRGDVAVLPGDGPAFSAWRLA